MTYAWLARAVEDFWRDAGGAGPFPRAIDPAVQAALPVSLVLLPHLTLTSVDRWLADHGIACCLADVAHGRRAPDRPRADGRSVSPPRGTVPQPSTLAPQPAAQRPLRGCLVAHGGRGLLFVDAGDSPADRRFTIAHEAAHLVCDYLLPRRDAIRRLGPAVAAVLDGARPVTSAERLDAALARVRLVVHTHLLDRAGPATVVAEDRADRLALELLAPAAEVARRLAGGASRDDIAEAARAAELLVAVFGLPEGVARGYARSLAARTARGSRIETLIGRASNSSSTRGIVG